MSVTFPQSAAPEAALRQAAHLGRRHGRAAVYWQIGAVGSPAAWEFYRELPSGIATAGPAVMGLYEVPDLTARWDYEHANLAADFHLADGNPAGDAGGTPAPGLPAPPCGEAQPGPPEITVTIWHNVTFDGCAVTLWIRRGLAAGLRGRVVAGDKEALSSGQDQ